jgi:hypothetical protein
MGGVLGCIDKRNLDSSKGHSSIDGTTIDDSKQSLLEPLETSHPYRGSDLIYRENKFTKILNSASNYWANKDQMTLFGSHRVISQYKADVVKGIYRINNIIITEEVY